MCLYPLRTAHITLKSVLNEGTFCLHLHLAFLLPTRGALSGWVVGSSCPCWLRPLIKVRSSSLAAVPARLITASALTLKLLFSSALLHSTHPKLNWHTADGITTVSPSSVLAEILGTIAASETPPKLCHLFFCPLQLLSLSWHFQIACLVWLTVINPQILNLQWFKIAKHHTEEAGPSKCQKWFIDYQNC